MKLFVGFSLPLGTFSPLGEGYYQEVPPTGWKHVEYCRKMENVSVSVRVPKD